MPPSVSVFTCSELIKPRGVTWFVQRKIEMRLLTLVSPILNSEIYIFRMNINNMHVCLFLILPCFLFLAALNPSSILFTCPISRAVQDSIKSLNEHRRVKLEPPFPRGRPHQYVIYSQVTNCSMRKPGRLGNGSTAGVSLPLITVERLPAALGVSQPPSFVLPECNEARKAAGSIKAHYNASNHS